MLGRAASPQLAAATSANAEAPAAPTITVLVVSPSAEAARSVGMFAREALPSESLIPAQTAAEAVSKADTAVHFGRTPAIFIFDWRGKPVTDLAEQLRIVRR